MAPKSLLDELRLSDIAGGGVKSSHLNCTVVRVSGVPVSSVAECERAVKLHQGQCVFVETGKMSQQKASGLTGTLIQAPGYFSGDGTLNATLYPPLLVCACLCFLTRDSSGEALRLELGVADALVRQRVEKIVSLSEAATACSAASENAQELQRTFDALFFSVNSVCSHLPYELSFQVTSRILSSNSTAVISAFIASPLSAAASKSLLQKVHNAQAELHSRP
jgi:hypothetical protein